MAQATGTITFNSLPDQYTKITLDDGQAGVYSDLVLAILTEGNSSPQYWYAGSSDSNQQVDGNAANFLHLYRESGGSVHTKPNLQINFKDQDGATFADWRDKWSSTGGSQPFKLRIRDHAGDTVDLDFYARDGETAFGVSDKLGSGTYTQLVRKNSATSYSIMVPAHASYTYDYKFTGAVDAALDDVVSNGTLAITNDIQTTRWNRIISTQRGSAGIGLSVTVMRYGSASWTSLDAAICMITGHASISNGYDIAHLQHLNETAYAPFSEDIVGSSGSTMSTSAFATYIADAINAAGIALTAVASSNSVTLTNDAHGTGGNTTITAVNSGSGSTNTSVSGMSGGSAEAGGDDVARTKINNAQITFNTDLVPSSADARKIGSAALEWAELYLGDSGVIHFGNDQDVTLTHVADKGLTLTHAGSGAGLPIVLQLKSEEDDVVAADVIASLEFAAGDSDGTDGATVAAGIHAIAEDTFSASANATKLVFTAGVSETAASSATAKMTLSSAGNLSTAGTITAVTSIGIGSAVLTEAELEKLDGITNGTAEASKALVVDGSRNIDTINALGIASMANNWTNASRTVADMGIVTTMDLNGGSIDGTVIGAAAVAAGSFAALVGTTGTFSAGVTATTISGSGAMQAASLHCDSVDVDGGAIDGTVIGANSVAAGSFAALVGTTGVFSGILKTDNATNATTTTDGSLQTDGGLSVVLDAVIGDDLILLSENAQIAFGADSEVTLAHVPDSGLLMESAVTAVPVFELRNTNADGTGATLKLNKNGASPADGDICGNIDFASEDDATNAHTFARINATIDGASSGAEQGGLDFYVAANDGTLAKGLQLQGTTSAGVVDVTLGLGGASTTTVAGHLTVTGTTTTINSTVLTVADDLITVSKGNDSVANADGSGMEIDVTGGTNLFWKYVHANTALSSNVDIDVASTKAYKIAGTSVLNATTLGSAVVNSSLTSLGTQAEALVMGSQGITGCGSIAGATSIDGSGDLTMGTITMPGFAVDADGDTNLKSLRVDDGSYIGSDSVTDLILLQADGDIIIKDGAYDFDIASHDGTNGLLLGGVTVTATAAELNYVDIATLGTAAASKALTIKGDSTWTVAGMTCADMGAVTTMDLNGGSIDGVTIGAAAVAAGSFAALVGTTGTFSAGVTATTISGSGAMQAASLHCDSVNVDGGAIDGTVIGANSAAAGSFAALVGTTGVFSGILKTDDATDATSTTDGSLQTDGGLSVALDAVVGNDLHLLSDSAVLNFGAGKDVSLTHTNDVGVHLNSGMRLGFRDQGGEYIYSVADGTLGIVAASEIDLTATDIDINGAVDISGVVEIHGAITPTGAGDASIAVGSDSLYFRDSDGTMKRDTVADIVSASCGSGLVSTAGVLSINWVRDTFMSASDGSGAGDAAAMTAGLTASLSRTPLADSVQVYLNGMLQRISGATAGACDYILYTSTDPYTVAMSEAVDSDDVVVISYITDG